MPTMKVTSDAAMRARDVSRPRAEHVAWAEAAEAGASAASEGVPVETGVAADTEVAVEAAVADAQRRAEGARRRRVRSSSRRGRPSR
jgi:hypothetical protein